MSIVRRLPVVGFCESCILKVEGAIFELHDIVPFVD